MINEKKNTRDQNRRGIKLSAALSMIFFSIVFISGPAAIGLLYFQHFLELRGNDPKFNIIAIIQTGPQKEALKTVYLAELLDLSIDRPTNLYHFNAEEAKKKLLANHLIKMADVKKIFPGAIYINYTIRKPIAFLGDYSNLALDPEGYIFPFKPFFTPKKLPEIVLGLKLDPSTNQSLWGKQLKGVKSDLAFELLNLIMAHCCSENIHLSRIDVSKAFAPSYGQRQIVITFNEQIEMEKNGQPILLLYPRILRLSSNNYAQELANYLVLRRFLREKESSDFSLSENKNLVTTTKIVDLRIPNLAFLIGE